MNRRDFLKCVTFTTGVLMLSVYSSLAGMAVRPARRTLPNILIIYADDMGYGDLACQNPNSKIPTPNLDRLARESVRFTDAHSSSGVCTPSRYALLTGRYHWRDFHGIVNAYEPSKFAPYRLTLPEMLKTKGYRTACIGKWHLGWDWAAIRNKNVREQTSPDAFDWSKPVPGGPIDHGFDYYFGDDVPNFPPYTWIENDRILIPPTAPLKTDPRPEEGSPECRPGPMAEGWRLDKVMPKLTEKTIAWIKQQSPGTPFFLFWTWTSPHAPMVPIKEYQGATDVGPYGDYMHQSDAHLGQVLKALEESGLAENTLIIFSSDNGPEHYAYPRIPKYGHSSMGPLRGLKRDIWEGGHRVPFIVRWPGVIKPGRVNDALTSQVDIMATLAAIVGADLPDNAAEDSYDQLPVWLDNTDRTQVRFEHVHNTYASKYAIRKNEWVLLDTQSGSHNERRESDWLDYEENPHKAALYNLKVDLEQRRNLLASYPEKKTEMLSLLNEIRDCGHSAPRLKNPTQNSLKR